jgi:hypothetical protein
MKNIKTFESFGDELLIHDICEEYDINDYTINPDGSIDVDGDVDLIGRLLTKIPLKFNKVSGHFDCYDNILINLEGCPKYVGGDFSCISSNLKSLVGSPIEVGGDFFCGNNELTSLEGGPERVGVCFDCSGNKLWNLNGCPISINYLDCSNNPIYDVWKLINDIEYLEIFLDYDMIDDRKIYLMRLNDILKMMGKEPVTKVGGYFCI